MSVTEVLGDGGRERPVKQRATGREKPFSFSNQLLHFSLDILCQDLQPSKPPITHDCKKCVLIRDADASKCLRNHDGNNPAHISNLVCSTFLLRICSRIFTEIYMASVRSLFAHRDFSSADSFQDLIETYGIKLWGFCLLENFFCGLLGSSRI